MYYTSYYTIQVHIILHKNYTIQVHIVLHNTSTHHTTHVLHNTSTHHTTRVLHNTSTHGCTQYKYTSYYTIQKHIILHKYYTIQVHIVLHILLHKVGSSGYVLYWTQVDTSAKDREQQPTFDFDQYFSKLCLEWGMQHKDMWKHECWSYFLKPHWFLQGYLHGWSSSLYRVIFFSGPPLVS